MKSIIITVTEPAAYPLGLDEVKLHLRLETHDDDAYLDSLIAAATKLLDGPEGRLGRCLIQRQLELQIPGWTNYCRWYPRASVDWWYRRDVELPLPPYVSLDAVSYLDSNGTEQPLDPDGFVVIPRGMLPALIRPVAGGAWPQAASDRPDAIRIRYTAGYAEAVDGVPSGIIPRNIIQAMLKAIGTAWENRDQPSDVYIDDTLIYSHRFPIIA